VKHYNKMARQAGMTLIELTVVLLVLIGLAGLMIPYVSGFVSKTHDSTGSDSLASLNSAIQRYDVQFMGQPNNYDSLMTSIAAGTVGTIYSKMMGGTTGATDYLKTVEVQGGSLAGVGINSLRIMNNSTTDATFAATNASVTIPDDTNLYTVAAINVAGASNCGMGSAMGCIETDDDLAFILGRPAGSINTTTTDYLAFGVGSSSGMVGKTISEAPVHFAKTGAMSAANKYNRILAIYAVPKTGVRCVLTSGGTDAGATEYWDTAAGGSMVSITDQTSCEAADTLFLVVDPTGTPAQGAAVTAAAWNSNGMAADASYVTTAMPMMKLEGLSGALASHYSSMDN